jgi:asparagine synthase (glutamine-hydrolysing)
MISKKVRFGVNCYNFFKMKRGSFMCAIAGAVNCQDRNLDPMQQMLWHRGPDEQSRYTHANLTLIHNRLAIVDIKGGHQPMHYRDHTLVFNGEIYNHRTLRNELREFDFRSESDTETLLYLLVKYGIEGLKKVDGMFAVALLNKADNTLTLIRDRMGKKPLYYYKKGDRFLFASEIGAIRSVEPLSPNETQIADYLRCGYFFGETTAYRDLFSLPPGSAMTLDMATMRVVREPYFSIETLYRNPRTCSLAEAMEEADTLLHQSVKDRLLSSDLEVGAFLSGGIDSGLIVAAASRYTKKLKTFTVSFDGAYDESLLAAQVAKQYGTDHTVIDIRMDLKNDLKTILSNYSQPFFDSSALPSYYVSKAAKKHVSVVLNGDGADELFGGYRRYVPAANGWIGLARKVAWLSRILPGAHNKKSLYSHLIRMLEIAGKSDPLAAYLAATTDIFEGYEGRLMGGDGTALREHLARIGQIGLSPLSQSMLADATTLLPSNLLVKMDIATMAHSLEGRSPFLSKYFLEFAPRLPDGLKIHGRTTKYLLRELAKTYLPPDLPGQPKRGFEIPLKMWVEGELSEMIRGYLDGPSYSQNFVDRSFITALLEKKVALSDEKRARMLWTLLTLEVWHENDGGKATESTLSSLPGVG